MKVIDLIASCLFLLQRLESLLGPSIETTSQLFSTWQPRRPHQLSHQIFPRSVLTSSPRKLFPHSPQSSGILNPSSISCMAINPEQRATAQSLLRSSEFLKNEIIKYGIKNNPLVLADNTVTNPSANNNQSNSQPQNHAPSSHSKAAKKTTNDSSPPDHPASASTSNAQLQSKSRNLSGNRARSGSQSKTNSTLNSSGKVNLTSKISK